MLKVRFLSFGIVYFQVLGFARPTSYAMLCLRGRCGVSCHKRWMSVCGCWLRCWVAHGCAKRSSGQIQVDVWNPELPVCDVGWRLAGFRGMLDPALHKRQVFRGAQAAIRERDGEKFGG